MSIRVIADSCCDVTPLMRSTLGLLSAPIKIRVDETEYADTPEFDTGLLLEAMKTTKNPLSSAAPAPEEYAELMRQCDECFVITLSRQLSGSYNAAMAARGMVLEQTPGKKITVLDSKSAAAGETRLALYLQGLIAAGESYESIQQQAQPFIDNMRTLFVLEDLSTLIKNGRIPRMTGAIGTLLMMRPIMGENGEGEIVPIEKIRGTRQALARLVELVAQRVAPLPHGSIEMVLAHCHVPERAVELKKAFEAACPALARVWLVPTGGLSTTYANAGGIICAYG